MNRLKKDDLILKAETAYIQFLENEQRMNSGYMAFTFEVTVIKILYILAIAVIENE